MAECYADVMLAAHSPPLFTARGAAQPELSVLYQNLLVITQKQQSPLSVRRYNTRAADSPTRDDGGGGGGSGVARFAPASKPRRPCLVNRTDSSKSLGNEADSSSSSSSDENEPASPTRRKKKVVFADDRGLSLTHVRLMNEPSNQPPKLTLAALPGGGVASAQQAPAAEPPQWTVRFSQPASSYLDFRKRLDVGNVSLENVIVKSPDRRLLGTVKVRNLSYDKEVFVRCTRDRWTTHQDTPCTYVQNNAMVTAAAADGRAGAERDGHLRHVLVRSAVARGRHVRRVRRVLQVRRVRVLGQQRRQQLPSVGRVRPVAATARLVSSSSSSSSSSAAGNAAGNVVVGANAGARPGRIESPTPSPS